MASNLNMLPKCMGWYLVFEFQGRENRTQEQQPSSEIFWNTERWVSTLKFNRADKYQFIGFRAISTWEKLWS